MGKAYDRVMEIRKELTKQLISEMSQGELCWIKGWNSTGKRPYNPITKAVYKGGNRFRLMLAAHLEQYTDNRWVTFAQAKEKGWTVKKGEKGMLCEKWIFEEKKTIEDPITGEKETVYEELEHPKVNYFVLFNAAQVEGMPALEKQPELPKDEQLMLADRFVRSSACPVVLVYKCRQKKLNSLYYKKKEQRRCSTWRKIKNRILRNSSSRSSISTMPEVPHILNWNMNMA